jgi:TonB family protein
MNDRKILIVDFDEDSLTSLSGLVNEEGFQAETATDGLAGYEKFQAEDYDLVILEPMLPKLHGFELCKKISQDPVKKIPIIVVTGIYREPSCKKEALQVYGASAFFTKPWNKDDLRAKMLQLLVERTEMTADREAPPASIDRADSRNSAEPGTADAKPKESRIDRNIDQIEKELQEVVADFLHPPKKKAVRETPEKKETKKNIESEIDAMLKGAIGELGLEAKKTKPEAPREKFKPAPEPREVAAEPPVAPEPKVKPTAPFKPLPPIAVDILPEQPQKIPIAREIKENIPATEKRPKNNLPPSSVKAHLEAKPMPFGIDQTLIEIDKIPLVIEDEPKAPSGTLFGDSKPGYFEEYIEPRKKKTTFLVVGGLIAAVIAATSITFIVLKSKKPVEPSREMVSSIQPSLPAEFSVRQSEVSAPPPAQKPESKPEPKRTAEQAAESQSSEYIPALQPEISVADEPTARLQYQPLNSSQAVSQRSEPPAPLAKEIIAPPPDADPQAPAAKTPAVKKGDLIPLDQVDSPPTLVKKIEPRYPPLALNMGLGGTVTVNALISETGEVVRTEILQRIGGGYGFEGAAEAAIRQWKFNPARKDDVPVKVWKPIDVTFKTGEIPTKE